MTNDLNEPATTHYVVRTNAKGQPMVGRCPQCGATGLTSADALRPCPNTLRVTRADSILRAIDGADEA